MTQLLASCLYLNHRFIILPSLHNLFSSRDSDLVLTVKFFGAATPMDRMNRKEKERAVALGLIAIGLFCVFYGVYNYYLFQTLQQVINFAWFLLFMVSGIPLSALGVVYTVISYSYFNRIKRLNESLK